MTELIVSDDDTNLEGATVSISNFTTEDTITFTPIPGNPVSVASNAAGVLTLTSPATGAQYEAALKSVTFSSSSDNPTENHILRTVTWQVFDGNVNSDEATSLILISPVNDAPTGTLTCSSLTTEDVYISGFANGAGWSLNTCAGATDPEGDTLTYQLDYISTGTTSSASYPCPTPIQSAAGGPPLTNVRSIAAGGEHTCATVSFDAVANEGIYCWGNNDNGQLGDNDINTPPADKMVATQVDATNSGLTSATTWFTQVVAGAAHTCALRTDGAVFCWGDNASGQLGDDSTIDRLLPTSVNGLGSGSGVVALSAGGSHTCAASFDGTVAC